MSSWKKYSHSIESSREYHERYHRAISNPIRRQILKLISLGLSENEIAEKLGISKSELDYHIQVLLQGFCIERKDNRFVITKEGKLIEHL
ncbi:MAG: helix-turn-helix domain-containing protein [Archaeoglobaceae archaeon]|nr:helix-turn-helix domain-containing protein [Archaeoglobaceae archaeon]MDW7989169.1 helix-turn-helix domain-containing protein [Archaeoglobaceae archaeon]